MPDLLIRVGGYAPPEATHTQALEAFGSAIRRMTDGRADVEVLPNVMDTGRPATALFDMVEAGELDLCYFSTSYLGSRVPELDILETPFLFRDLDEAHTALDGALGRALSEITEAKTPFRALGYWDNGFRHFTNLVRDVKHPDDTRGMRVRLQPNRLHEAMIEAWGAVPAAVELSRAIEMIRSGEVDAQENPLANTVAYGVDRLHRHVTMTGHLYGARGVYANPGLLERAGDDVIGAAVREAIDFQRSAARQREVEYRQRMTEQGAMFIDLDPDQRSAFVDASAPAIELARSEIDARWWELASA